MGLKMVKPSYFLAKGQNNLYEIIYYSILIWLSSLFFTGSKKIKKGKLIKYIFSNKRITNVINRYKNLNKGYIKYKKLIYVDR
jgi:hypothetical protein